MFELKAMDRSPNPVLVESLMRQKVEFGAQFFLFTLISNVDAYAEFTVLKMLLEAEALQLPHANQIVEVDDLTGFRRGAGHGGQVQEG